MFQINEMWKAFRFERRWTQNASASMLTCNNHQQVMEQRQVQQAMEQRQVQLAM